MKNLTITALLTTTLLGCASYEEQRARARGVTNEGLCVAIATNHEYSGAAADELASRGAKCDWQQIQALVQMRRSSTPAYQPYYLPQPKPSQPLPARNPVNCTSNAIGGTVYTNCQ